MPYEAPTIVRYGSVAGLTASTIKCTPGTDWGLSGPTHIAATSTDNGATWYSTVSPYPAYDPDADDPNCFHTLGTGGPPPPPE